MNGLEFEWDEVKAAANMQKHGVAFETATEAFGDAFGIESIDTSMDHGEPRLRLIARAGQTLLVVVYTERGDRIRIISARQATRRDHDRYYRENAQG